MIGFIEIVMAGLVPAIHVLAARGAGKTWMPGTSPGMTNIYVRRDEDMADRRQIKT
jgi:hypothetical protein